MPKTACPLCTVSTDCVLWSDPACLVILATAPGIGDVCQVVWRHHVPEMTDLTAADRAHVMAVVYAVEEALRVLVTPAKINLASLGNVVPHLHWHVIPRYPDDAFFPDPIWASARRTAVARAALPAAAIGAHVARHLAAGMPAPAGR
ncbi:MAG: HIT family protein [Acidiferrobacter sp.]